jgi:Derlin-2/3
MLTLTFLGNCLSSVMVYVWSRRNPDALLSLLGLFTFRAPWLPLVLMGFSFTMHGQIPKDEICGLIVGHSKSFNVDWEAVANMYSLVLFQ